ncbi:MAG: DNA ligase [Thiothrix sp.]|nr:MAG: DNA ligase [Thiothrix sp.]
MFPFQFDRLQPTYLDNCFLLFILLFPAGLLAEVNPNVPDVLLAQTYEPGINVSEYWVSEKLDGVRARWDGQRFISRQGNIFHSPTWFTAEFPLQALDGELWIERNNFEQVVSTVRTHVPNNTAWREIRFMVFDLPESKAIFSDRLKTLKSIFSRLKSPYLKLIKHYRLDSHTLLMNKLQDITQAGGEGLMLHHQDSLYFGGRSDALLKLKLYQDAEAEVIEHLPGNGKYTGMLGALRVITADGKYLRIGTGFTDDERKNPPPIGITITYKYFGKTRNGIPKFASFLRIRNPVSD